MTSHREWYFERSVRKQVGPSDTLGTAAGPPLCASHESDRRGVPDLLGELVSRGRKRRPGRKDPSLAQLQWPAALTVESLCERIKRQVRTVVLLSFLSSGLIDQNTLLDLFWGVALAELGELLLPG